MHDLKKFLLITLTCLQSVSFASVSFTQDVSQPPSEEIACITEAIHLWSTFRERIWPDYDVNKIPVLIFDSETKQWLINHPNPPADWITVDYKNKNIFIMGPESKPVWRLFLTGGIWKINGHWTAIFATESAWRRKFPQHSAVPPPPEWAVSVTIHEGFHVFQAQLIHLDEIYEFFNRKPLKDMNEVSKSMPHHNISETDQRAPLILREQRLLNEAFETPDNELCLSKIKEFLQCRKERFKQCDAKEQLFENCEELMEGTARYIDIRLGEEILASYEPSEEIKKHPRFENYKFKEWELKRFLTEGHKGRLDEVRFKITGGFICKLLDRLEVKDWKKDIFSKFGNNRIALTDILKKAVKEKAKGQKTFNREEVLDSQLELVKSLSELFKKDKQVWPGFSLKQVPLLIYSPKEKKQLLFNHPQPSDDFVRVEVFASEKPNIHISRAPDFEMYNLMDKINERLTVCINYDYTSSITQERFLIMVIHEMFHLFQKDSFKDLILSNRQEYPVTNLENNALILLELKILNDILKNLAKNNMSSMDEELKEYTSIHEYRLRTCNEYMKKYETYMERLEGTADYVGNVCQETPIEKQIKSREKKVSDIFQTSTLNIYLDYIIREGRFYVIGFTLGLTFDKLGIPWKERLARSRNTGFSELLREQYSLKDEQISSYVSSIKRNYDYENVLRTLKEIEKVNEEEVQKLLKKFREQSADRILIRSRNKALSMTTDRTEPEIKIENGKIEYYPHVKFANIDVASNRISISNQDFFISRLNDEYLEFHFFRDISETKLSIKGREIPIEVGHKSWEKGLLLSKDFSLKFHKIDLSYSKNSGIYIQLGK